MTNSFIVLTKESEFDLTLFNEFLENISKEFEINSLNDFYLVKLNYENTSELEETVNSYICDIGQNVKAYISDFENEAELYDTLDVILKYLTKSLKGIVYNKRTLLNEVISQELSDYKVIVLKDYSDDYDMQNTLITFFKNNMNVLKTSKELYCHRNTLINKLDKFKEKTGFDPKNFTDAYLIYSLIK